MKKATELGGFFYVYPHLIGCGQGCGQQISSGVIMKLFGGFSLGTVIAVALSWSANHSILWAIIHGFCSWLYVIYYALFK
ncbi:hypothetical protein HZU75_02930 [Chitinibacter fontanus]|uniref:Uncharacterized protein n=1 Tax=Chitinibacter fontanus TaxID=1737446 RepID=A0A7D5Z7M0_9NEIS|nr:hypothetical protein [Chitinibacter fontanus]QLI80045.1 hypothetical protein HZU75_02930 [Chitinibacter fontanus]